MEQQTNSILTLEEQKKLTLTGVESVDRFLEGEICLTVCGKRVRITGARLKVLSFSKGNGNFSAIGEINAIHYGGVGKKSLSKLFK